MGKKSAQAYFRRLITTHQQKIVVLLETQLSEVGMKKVLGEFGRGWKAHDVHAHERSGGILMMIRYNEINQQVIAIEIEDDE